MGRLPLSHLLLLNDANYPWFILVPDIDDISEIYQLSEKDQQQLITESSLLGQTLMAHFKGDKLNIGALGNMVPQLHIHHIVRYRSDPAWPAPVWGRVPPKPYAEKEIDRLIMDLKPHLTGHVVFL